MKRETLLLVIMLIWNIGFSQIAGITGDGRYVYSFVDKTNDESDTYLVVQSTDNLWKLEIKIEGKNKARFCNDRIIYLNNDSLFVLKLGTDMKKSISSASTFETIRDTLHSRIIYRSKIGNSLFLYDINDDVKREYDNVTKFMIDPTNTVLFLNQVVSNKDAVSENSVSLVNIRSGSIKRVWVSNKFKIVNYSFSADGKTLAFMTRALKDNEESAIWTSCGDEAKVILSESDLKQEDNLTISDASISFVDRSDNLLFFLRDKKLLTKKMAPSVVVWSYNDPLMQSLQEKRSDILQEYATVLDTKNVKLIRLENRAERLIAGEYNNYHFDHPEINGKFALTVKFDADIFSGNELFTNFEFNWNKKTKCNVYLISLSDGVRKLLREKVSLSSTHFPYYYLSPGAKYVVGFDDILKHWLSYEIATGKWTDLSKKLSVGWVSKSDEAGSYNNTCQIIGWSKNDDKVFIQDDQFDIWKLDLNAVFRPLKITDGLGNRNKLSLSPVNNSKKIFGDNERVFLLAAGYAKYRNEYINRGYYSVRVDDEHPKCLIKEGGLFNFSYIDKAQFSDVFLFKRENRNTAPSVFYTKNFITFDSISSGQKELRNGIKKELVAWKTFKGKICHGVLFYPDNFNSNHKYPVVVSCYENQTGSYDHFDFVGPRAWSNYLIFLPDIYFTLGQIGTSIHDCVVSGVEFLKTKSFVDGKKIGLQGNSFGGYIANYLVAHTNVFAAVWSTCGFSDPLSFYTTIDRDNVGRLNHGSVELGQARLGTNPWERPDLYIKNSALWYADKVNSPLLLSHFTGDYRVPFDESLQFFKALRRLGKKVWLVSSAFEGHGGPEEPYAIQFFDYYLRGKPAPRWMLEPISYSEQGDSKWLELDSTGKTPDEGLLMKNENALSPIQKELLKHKTTVNNEGRIVDVPADKPKKIKPKMNK